MTIRKTIRSTIRRPYYDLVKPGSGLNSLICTLEKVGDGSGVSTLCLETIDEQTIIIEGAARFYTDSGGTTGESISWTVAPGALRTIYLKCPANSTMRIYRPWKIKRFGNTSFYGWISTTNAAKINIDINKLSILTEFCIAGNSLMTGKFTDLLENLLINSQSVYWTYAGSMPSALKTLRILSDNVNLTTSGAFNSNLELLLFSGQNITYESSLPFHTNLRSIFLYGSKINYTGLDIGGGDMVTVNISNYRIAKMPSADMITFLTNLKNRVGTLPGTITVNDYADYASPPAGVVTAVNELKAAKSITTVNLGA